MTMTSRRTAPDTLCLSNEAGKCSSGPACQRGIAARYVLLSLRDEEKHQTMSGSI